MWLPGDVSKSYRMGDKYCRPWTEVRSLFAQSYLSEHLGYIW